MIHDKRTPEQIQAERIERTQRLARAFRIVFGTDQERTEPQRAVWEFLEHSSFAKRSTHAPDERGHFDPIGAALCEGMRMSFLQIKELVEKPLGEKPKPESIR